jgi:hypothetical protein
MVHRWEVANMANQKVSDGQTIWVRIEAPLHEAIEKLARERGCYHGTDENGQPKPNVSGMARIALRTGVGALLGNGNGGHGDAGE